MKTGRNNLKGQEMVPVGVHPLVARFYELLNEERKTQKEVSLGAGLCYRYAHDIRKRDPVLTNFDALLNALGYELAIVPLSRP
jgi:hypothetical protein